MYANRLDTLEDAYAVVMRYGLHHIDLGDGTAEGLAAYLFTPGRPVEDVRAVALAVDGYIMEAFNEARSGRNLDELLAEDAKGLDSTLKAHAATVAPSRGRVAAGS